MQSGERDPSLVYGVQREQMIAPGTDQVGSAWAISVETGATAWRHEQRAGLLSMVATAGGLVFAGDAVGRFKAFDDTSGEVLWETSLGRAVSGYPISFAVDGTQYVAVTTGPSLTATRARQLTPELEAGSGEPRVHVFALP